MNPVQSWACIFLVALAVYCIVRLVVISEGDE